MSKQCNLPPPGWRCIREPGHEGPCAAMPVSNRDGLPEVTEKDFEAVQAVIDQLNINKRRMFDRKANVIEVPLDDKYLRALDEICARKDMSRYTVIWMALRWLQILEETPGAYDAVNALRPHLANVGCMGDD